MRYLARSFVGGTERYALTPPDKDDFWTGLGIAPVHFPMCPEPAAYGAIDRALASWATWARMGAFDHKARITQLAETLPPVDQHSVDYLCDALAQPVRVTFFTEVAIAPEWIAWLEEQGLLAPLTDPALLSTQTPQLLAYWLADRFAVQHTAVLLDFVQRHAARLNPEVSRAIAARNSDSSPDDS